MRALYLNPLPLQDFYLLKDEPLHHLVNVVRIEVGEKILLLNGEGLSVETVVESVQKREVRLQKTTDLTSTLPFHLDLALGIPKREALELCLKEATELGFKNIFLIKSDFSQTKVPEAERMNKLLISALEQSNSPVLPRIAETTWESLPWENYEEALLLDSQSQVTTIRKKGSATSKYLLIVGPEGGFSPQELNFLHKKEMVRVVKLPTPILRTPTALATGTGVLLESLLN